MQSRYILGFERALHAGASHGAAAQQLQAHMQLIGLLAHCLSLGDLLPGVISACWM